MADTFFDEQEDQSAVKAAIVVDYFVAWSNIMAKRVPKMAYIDLYAGRGRYGDGHKSTPLLILEHAIASPQLRSRLITIFNDADRHHVDALQAEIDALPGVNTLAYKPDVQHGEVGEGFADVFESMKTVPVLGFIDPWGYKGLSRRLIKGMIKDFGCEAIFFFNYNRINMAITNDRVEPHMTALFGDSRLSELRRELAGLSSHGREAVVRRALGEVFEEIGAAYLIPFEFRRRGGRLSHHICFVTKHPLGYSIMKSVMASKGVVDADGVPTFEYMPRQSGRQLAFDESRPILSLAGELRQAYRGRSLTVGSIYDDHNVGTPFIKPNYKTVLKEMELRGEVSCEPPLASRPRNTMADGVIVTFPS